MKLYYLFPGIFPAACPQTRGFPRLTRASILFFICFIKEACGGPVAARLLLHLTGYTDITLDELKRFRQLGSRTAGHPERGHAAGIETTTGPLGQGIGNSVGMALAERMLAAEFGDEIVDHHTYVIASDGDLMEGVSHEAASFAGHLGLNKLIVSYDDNSISIDG